jgi:starch synthase
MADPAPVLGLCDVYAHLALNEALGFAVAEAMYLGKPVVAANRAGIPELIEQRATGILIEPDATAAAEALEWVFADDRRAQDMGRLARATVTRLYNWDAVEAQYIRIYSEVAGRTPP